MWYGVDLEPAGMMELCRDLARGSALNQYFMVSNNITWDKPFYREIFLQAALGITI